MNRIVKITLCACFMMSVNVLWGQESRSLSSLDEAMILAKAKNITFRNDVIQQDLAALTRKTALGNVINPRIPTSFQMQNNTKLQASLLPAEIFGGTKGTFREVAFGQQYVSTFSLQPQFDLLNLASIEQIKSAKINQELVSSQQKIAEQRLYEQMNVVYCNILAFQAQIQVLKENIVLSERIKTIVENKFKEGLARKQELNEAEVNIISLQDKISQLEQNVEIQTQTLSLFFENSIKPNLTESLWNYEKMAQTMSNVNSNLVAQNYDLQLKMAVQDLKIAKYQQLPTLGLITSFNWQNNSNDAFFSKNSNWIRGSYVGLRMNWDLPSNVQKLSTVQVKTLNYETLKNNAEHARKEEETKNTQLRLEYQKAISQLANMQKIYTLKEDTYNKNDKQFLENILSLDKLLLSQNELLISKMNIVTTLANISFNKNKIDINQKL